MPKKLLSVGMGRVFFSQVGEQIFGLLAGDLKPEGIGAKIQLARPRQDAALLADGRIAEEFVVSPWRENAFPYLSGKIHFAFGAVFEAQPDTIAVEDFRSNDLYHAKILPCPCIAVVRKLETWGRPPRLPNSGAQKSGKWGGRPQVFGNIWTLTKNVGNDGRPRFGIQSEPGRRGILQMTAGEYFDLVDKSGRMTRSDKLGTIDADLAPMLLRIGANPDAWPETVSRFGSRFRLAAGLASNLRNFADQLGKRWLQGAATARAAFASSPPQLA
jgi:hypothetical protein